MDTLTNKLPHLPLRIAGVGAILVSGIAIVSIALAGLGWGGVSTAAAAPEATGVPAIAAPARSTYLCAECGVIESVREIAASDEDTAATAQVRSSAGSRGAFEVNLLRSYEITIRLRDGSMRVVRDAHPANWRRGEPVTVIAGVD